MTLFGIFFVIGIGFIIFMTDSWLKLFYTNTKSVFSTIASITSKFNYNSILLGLYGN